MNRKAMPKSAMPDEVKKAAQSVATARDEERTRDLAERVNLEDLVKNKVTIGDVSLPLPNLVALGKIRKMLLQEGFEFSPDHVVKLLWILSVQDTERILEVDENPPTDKELWEYGKDINVLNVDDYVDCILAMLQMSDIKKKLQEKKQKGQGSVGRQ
jgi:hypothetical protein